MFILTLLNYAEIAICYSIIAFLAQGSFLSVSSHSQSFNTIADSFRYSIGILITTGSDYHPSTLQGYAIFSTEIVLALTFIIVVINRALSLYRKR